MYYVTHRTATAFDIVKEFYHHFLAAYTPSVIPIHHVRYVADALRRTATLGAAPHRATHTSGVNESLNKNQALILHFQRHLLQYFVSVFISLYSGRPVVTMMGAWCASPFLPLP